MTGSAPRLTEAQVRRELLRFEDQASRRRKRIGAAVVLALALALGALAARFQFVLVDVRGDGMEAALRPGDAVLCVRGDAPVLAAAPGRGSLALMDYDDSGLKRQTLRRVIAVAGDEVSLDETGRVTLNGAALEEPYVAYRSEAVWTGEAAPGGALENPFAEAGETPVQDAGTARAAEGVDDVEYPLTVPEGKLFVLCDNRENPLDSRGSRFGLVDEADVRGLAWAVVWPVHRVGLLPDAGIR